MEHTRKFDFYSELGLDLRSTVAEIKERVEEERERSNRLKKIPKRCLEAESRLTQLAEIEHVLLDTSARAAYDSRLQAEEPSAKAVLPAERRLPTSATEYLPDHEVVYFCTSCGAALPGGASFCAECADGVHNTLLRDSDTDASVAPDVPADNRIPDDSQTAEVAQAYPTDLKVIFSVCFILFLIELAILANR